MGKMRKALFSSLLDISGPAVFHNRREYISYVSTIPLLSSNSHSPGVPSASREADSFMEWTKTLS